MRPNRRSASAPRIHRRWILVVWVVPALLAGCGVPRNVEGVGGGSCTGCHGDPARSGDPAIQPAPADAHVAHLDHGVACGACHEVPTSRGHASGAVEVVFSGIALASGARPAYDPTTHRCSGVYCHRPFPDGGGTVASPAWTDRLACGACHGRPPPDHDAADAACERCHPGTVQADGAVDLAAGRHVDGRVEWNGAHHAGWSAPDRHGRAALDDLAGCRRCHGRDLAGGGGAAPSCEGCHATAGHPGWQSSCTFCHGAPPPPPHVGSTACGTCHPGYTDTTVDPTLHLNGVVDATRGGHDAAWLARHGSDANREGLASCKGCHGARLDGVGGTAQGCSGCHARAGTPSWATSCTFCHGTRGGSAAPPEDTQGGSSRGDVSVGAHAAHLGTGLMNGVTCNVCHPDRSGSDVIGDPAHVDGDGVAEVTLGGIARRNGSAATYTRGSARSASCASVYCHGRRAVSWTSTARMGCTGCHATPPGTPAHNGDHRSRLGCDACHPGYGTTYVNRATHIDGTVAFSKTCTSCHGSEDD